MNIKELRAKTGLSQRKFGEKLGLQGQSILLYEKEERKIPESVQKLISYVFAEYLPENERLTATVGNGNATAENETINQLQRENEELKKRLSTAGDQEAYIEVLKDNIALLKQQIELYKDQVELYKKRPAEENDRSKTA